MGFLLGAYGKLAAGSRYRSLQARMMRIQSKIRRATRDVANMEKMIDRRQKQMESQLQMQNTAAKTMYMQQMQGTFNLAYANDLKTLSDKGAEAADRSASASKVQQAQQEMSSQISQMTAAADTQLALDKQYIENQVEMMRDQLLEPLKDEEDSLQLEKDTLESQIQVAKTDYEACQKMEQADVKMLTPNYTGGQ